MNILILIFYLIELTSSISLHFPNPLQRFVYDDNTDTIILASVNHIYSLNTNDLSILSNIDISSSSSNNDEHKCLNINKTSLVKNLYYFSTSSYLKSSINQIFNQLLLLINNTILICSTSNRGGSCQLRSLINLNLIQNSSQRIVSSSPFYSSIGFINKNNQILYLSNTYDYQCDSFYEIPTISGRHLNTKDFLSLIKFNSGQSALQQTTYTLRLLNIRLIKDFFLHYLYGFEYKYFSFFLTIQQSDIYDKQIQTKIIRFCQLSKQSIIKSYIEIPLTCGKNYQYLITAKFSKENNILYGLFRNTTLANLNNTSHAICAYSIDDIQQGFFQTIKRCLVDGKGHRGLGFISPNTHCISNKNLNEINEDYCPDENESFFQYPIGGHQAIEQIQPIIELNDRVNFTAIEIGLNKNDIIIFIGDDHGTVHTFQTSNINEIFKQQYQSKIIIDLKLIHHIPTLKHAKLLILTNNQIIKQNLNICEQYLTCNQCSNISRCHWCSKENRCTSTFECIDEYKKINRINMCINIKQVIPEIISFDTLNTKLLQIILNIRLENNINEYMCRFTFDDRNEEFYQTKAIVYKNTIKCLPPLLNQTTLTISNIILSIYHIKTNLIFGYYHLKFINCSNFLSCSSCTSISNFCQWNPKTIKCLFQSKENFSLSNSNQCPSIYLQQSHIHLIYNIDKTLLIHIEQCNSSLNIHSCRLYNYRKDFSLKTLNPILTKFNNQTNSCLLRCQFQWSKFSLLSFNHSLNLHLSIEFSNQTILIIPNTHIYLYNQYENLTLNNNSYPILYLSNKYQSFISGGHQLIILGENFNSIKTIQLKFPNEIFILPLFRNRTHLIFLTPSIEKLNLKISSQEEILITIYLDNFNRTTILSYFNDPIIYELQPIVQTYTNQLIIHGRNLTTIGHTKNNIYVHIGCDICTIIHLQSNQIVCQPPENHPKKYSKTKHLCYNSEHPSIIVSIDNIHSHIGFMIYPKKFILLGVIIGCLITILFIVLIILIIICLKIRYTEKKNSLYNNRIIPHEKISQSIKIFFPIRSYVNYLQLCYASNHLILNRKKYDFNQELLEQFEYFIKNNDQFIDYLFKHSIELKNKKILNNLILIQRYNFKKLFQFHDDFIYFNICMLTFYDLFSMNYIHSLFSQLYLQLKSKIYSGPIDVIEQTMSYYSLNINKIIHDHMIAFKTIQLIIHIDSNDLVINLTCLTCDTISQIKQKILFQLNLFRKISINECQLYLLTNSCCSSSSSSSTASSSVPLIRKSMLTQAFFNHTIKYSTTTINDSNRELNHLLLNDIDNTNEQINNSKKLNTLQHYGILNDGYEMKIIIPNLDLRNTLHSSCHYCSLPIFNYLTLSSFNENNQLQYTHLLNHTYEEIENKNSIEIYRLFETKSAIHSVLINLIENLFINHDIYLNELIKEYTKIFHIFYAHFIPFIFRNLHCLFDISIDKCLNSSLDILAMIFQIACYQQNEQNCSLCIELFKNENWNFNIQNCTLVFADEIQRIRLYYSNLERCLKKQNLISEYSSTNTGIDKTFQLDNSILSELMEYSYLHANEIIEHLKNQPSHMDILSKFLNLVQMYQSNERT